MTLQPLAPLASLESQAIALEDLPEIDYPDSDGNPMADNTEQYRWIVIIKENLEIMYADDPHVFIAGDLLWYPVRRSQKRVAPDVMVASKTNLISIKPMVSRNITFTIPMN